MGAFRVNSPLALVMIAIGSLINETRGELDALIAEKVMGWKPNFNGTPTNVCTYEVCPHEDKLNHEFVFHPEYSTWIGAAFAVVNKFVSQGDYVSIFSTKWSSPMRPMASGWACQISSDDTALADTIEHAICLAALKAVGVEIKE